MNRRWKIWLGVLVSALALVLAFYKVDWAALFHAICSADPYFILAGVFTLGLNLVARAWRWQIILQPIGRFDVFKSCMPHYMIGYMANLTLPLRVGEVIRPVLFGQKMKVPKTAVFMSVLIERLIDLFFLSCLLSFVLFVGTTQIPVKIQHGTFLISGGAIFLLILLWYLSKGKRMKNSFAMIDGYFPERFSVRITGLFESVSQGLRFFNKFSLLIWTIGTTLLVWLFSILTVQAYLLAFDIILPWYVPVFVLVTTNVGMMLPSSPGFVGVAHFLYVFSLSLFGVDKNIALGFAIVIHGVGVIVIIATGIFYLFKEELSFSMLKTIKKDGS